MLKTWLDGPLAHLVRRLAHPPAKMYIGFPNSRLDGPLACLVCRLVVPQLKLYIYCFCQMKYCYMAYQLIWQPTYAKKQVGWPPGMPGPQAGQCGHPPAKTVYTFCPNI